MCVCQLDLVFILTSPHRSNIYQTLRCSLHTCFGFFIKTTKYFQHKSHYDTIYSYLFLFQSKGEHSDPLTKFTDGHNRILPVITEHYRTVIDWKTLILTIFRNQCVLFNN